MSWVADPAFRAGAPFGPQALPYGVLAGRGVAVRLGDHALPLRPVAGALGEPELGELAAAENLDPLLAAGHDAWQQLRAAVVELVQSDSAPSGAELLPLSEARPVLPFTVGDYVDFYSSRDHAENAGRILRPGSAALPANWAHLPVGYHGRSGTVCCSGGDIARPAGQRRDEGGPVFGPSHALDAEAEVGFVCGGPVATRVPVAAAERHVFGVVLLNDWSARDIQGFESVPLGPFLGKSFATSVSAWVTPLAAFEAARVPVPRPAQPLAPYLVDSSGRGGLDLSLRLAINGTAVSRPPFARMSWGFAQQLAHMTVNGATVRPGDLFASGTVSGPDRGDRGCLLELTWGASEPLTLGDGSTRTYLADGDTVTITATAPGPAGSVVGVGDVTGTVVSEG